MVERDELVDLTTVGYFVLFEHVAAGADGVVEVLEEGGAEGGTTLG